MFAGLLPGLIKGAISIGGGLLQQRSARKAAREERNVAVQDDLERFVRLREGAEMAGFNPLTALQYGGTSQGSFPSGVAPLASIGAITGGTQSIADEFTGEAAQRRMRESLETDLAKVRLDQAIAELKAGPSPGLGRSVPQSAVGYQPRRSGIFRQSDDVQRAYVPANEDALAPGRKVDMRDVEDYPGFFRDSNAITDFFTGGKPIYLPGSSGNVDDLTQQGVKLAYTLPQVGYHVTRRLSSSSAPGRGVNEASLALSAMRRLEQSEGFQRVRPALDAAGRKLRGISLPTLGKTATQYIGNYEIAPPVRTFADPYEGF